MTRTIKAEFGNPDPKVHSVRFNEVPDAENTVHLGSVYLKKTSLGPDWKQAKRVSLTIEVHS
jgi:hypothetical protein